jgi:hypothetical protein
MSEMQDPDKDNHSFMKRMRDVAIVSSGELMTSNLYQKMLLGATALGIVFEWGPGNEWLIGGVGSETHSSFDPSNIGEFIAASAVTGVAAGASSTAEQALLGTMMSGTVRMFPKTFTKWDDTRTHEAVNPEKGDIALGIALGVSAVVVEKNSQNPERTLRDDLKLTGKTALGIGAFNTVLVTGASLGVRAMEDLGLEDAAHITEEILKNPITYIALFGLYKANEYRKVRKERKTNDTLEN